MEIKLKISMLVVYRESRLVIDKLLTEYEVTKDDLIPYYRLAT